MPSLELALVIVLVLVNGLLSMSELAIVSARPARLRALAERNVKGARRALALSANPGRFLSTVQIGITLVGIIAGAVSGATLGARVSTWFEELGMAPAWAQPVGYVLVVALITYGSLVIGELVPKHLALRNPERIACLMAPAMTVLAKISAPLVWLLDISTTLVLRIFGGTAQSSGQVSDEEIKMLVAEAESAGVIEPGERQLIAGVMELGDRPVRSVMTPRHVVDLVDLAASPVQIRKILVETPHSRLPVIDGDPDVIKGVIHVKDMLKPYLRGRKPDPRNYVRKAPVIPDTMDALEAIERLRSSDTQMLLIYDEYGHFEGLVTAADILHGLSGSHGAVDGGDDLDALEREDGSWLISGAMPADNFAQTIGSVLPARRTFNTVAGFVLEHLGHMPRLGETFEVAGWSFEIVDLDGRRIDKILATPLHAKSRTHRTR